MYWWTKKGTKWFKQFKILDVDKLVPAPVDLSKLCNVVKKCCWRICI